MHPTLSTPFGLERALAKGAPVLKENVRRREHRLCQVADTACGFELPRLKFGRGAAVAPHAPDPLFLDDARGLRSRPLRRLGRMRLS